MSDASTDAATPMSVDATAATANDSAAAAAQAADVGAATDAAGGADGAAAAAAAAAADTFVMAVDLGTTRCVVAVASSGVEQLPAAALNNLSNIQTPSLVSFAGNERFVGEEAATRQAADFANCVGDVKATLGRTLDECTAAGVLADSPTRVAADARRDGALVFSVDYTLAPQLAPEQCAAMLFTRLRRFAEEHLEQRMDYARNSTSVRAACVAVPACYSDAQRRAVRDALAIAGLDCVGLVHESTAAALLLAMRETTPPTPAKPAVGGDGDGDADAAAAALPPARTVAVVDIGASYASVELVALRERELTQLFTRCSPTLGSSHIDLAMARHCAAAFTARTGVALEPRTKPWLRLLKSVQKTKHLLSTIPEASVDCMSVSGDHDLQEKLTRTKMEELAADYLAALRTFINDAVRESGVAHADIAAVEIIGGGTRIAAVREIIKQAFGDGESLDDDAAAAAAAAGDDDGEKRVRKVELSFHLDSTTSVAIGAGLAGMAMLGNNVFPASKTVAIADDVTWAQRGGNGDAAVATATAATAEHVVACAELERTMQARDAENARLQQLSNAIETSIYDYRDKLEQSSFAEALAADGGDTAKASVRSALDAVEQWLWDTDAHADTFGADAEAKQRELHASVAAAAPAFTKRIADDAERARREAEEAAKQVYVAPKTDRTPKTDAQRVEFAEKMKVQGNAIFKEFDYERAAIKYATALGYLKDLYSPSDEQKAAAQATRLSCLLNISQCYLKLDKPNRCVQNCNEVLLIDANNVKALFRRALARKAQKEYDDANADLLAAQKIDNNADVRRELAALKQILDKQKQKEKAMYGRMFA